MEYIDKFNLDIIPILDDQVTLFSKETGEGNEIFIPKKMPQMESLEINPTSRFILDKIREKKTISEILKILIEKYPEIDEVKLKTDLIDFIKELNDMNFLHWSINPFVEATKKYFDEYILLLDDIKNIKNHIDIEDIKYDDLLIKKVDLSEQRLEVLTFLKREVFFSLKRGEDYILVLRVSNRFSGIWFKIAYINNDFDLSKESYILKESLKTACEYYRNEYERKYGINFGSKIITYFTDYEDIKLYSSIGFNVEGMIEKAIDGDNEYKNLYLMGCCL